MQKKEYILIEKCSLQFNAKSSMIDQLRLGDWLADRD